MKKILQKEEKVLRKIAKEIPLKDIRTAPTRKIIQDMSEALASQDDGVAIAAPQIGHSVRIFIVSQKIFEADSSDRGLSQGDGLRGSAARTLADSDPGRRKSAKKNLVFINPKIIKLSRDREWLPEGCLSVRPIYGKTHRAKKATIVAYDAEGHKFQRGASGLLAQIFQHETDHLEGILFIDHAKNLEEEQPENWKANE